MKDILLVAKNHVLTALREKITLFWFMIFPIFLLVVLSFIFGQVGQEGEISFDIALVNADRAAAGPTAAAAWIEGAFDRIASAAEPGKEPLFRLHKPDEDDDIDEFLEEEMTAVRRGRRAALIVLPEGFSTRIGAATISDPEADGASVQVYYSEGKGASEMAAGIIEQVLSGVDRELQAQMGSYDPARAVATTATRVGTAEDEEPYVNFLLPGIVIMGFFMNGLFGIPGAVLFSRDQLVLRRYWVTPLTVPRFLAGLSIGHLALCVVQFALLYAVGRFALGATISFAQPATILLLLFAAVTFMAFGFLIASVSKTANSGMAIANILNMPMMFLSGLFFPISGLPIFIRVIVFVNPLSYLADSLRASLGVGVATYPMLVSILVPLGWIALSSAVAAWRLRWDVGR